MIPSKIDAYIIALLAREAGYVDHPADRGGPTNFGITQRVAQAFGYHGSMQEIPKSVAKSIYLSQYWSEPGFDRIEQHSAAVAEELLDTGVNMGPSVASRFLQRSLNVLNQEGRHYPDMVVDGKIGAITVAALRAYLAVRGKDAHLVLVRMLNALQGTRYIEIAEGRASQEAFIHGWFLHRVV